MPDHLLDHPDLWRAGDLRRPPETVPSGFAELDAQLPGGGWPRGGLSELLFDTAGIGELRLLLPALRTLSQQMRWIAWVNPPFIPYAPALSAAGIDISRILLIHPRPQQPRQQHAQPQPQQKQQQQKQQQKHKDALWALERASRSGTCSAVLAWLDERQLTVPDTRRLQLAAREGNTLSCLFRPGSAAALPSMAELRLAMRPVVGLAGAMSGAEVSICKRRGGWPVASIPVQFGESCSPAEIHEQLSLWRHWRGAASAPAGRERVLHVIPSSSSGKKPDPARRPVTH
ncbi:MAG: translesion DNA synthesis-associated protein ImuA [Pseudomonadales bacterium]